MPELPRGLQLRRKQRCARRVRRWEVVLCELYFVHRLFRRNSLASDQRREFGDLLSVPGGDVVRCCCGNVYSMPSGHIQRSDERHKLCDVRRVRAREVGRGGLGIVHIVRRRHGFERLECREQRDVRAVHRRSVLGRRRGILRSLSVRNLLDHPGRRVPRSVP